MFDCTTQGSETCCAGEGAICFSNGSCSAVSFGASFVYHGVNQGNTYCQIWANLSGFEPSTSYYVEGLQYFDGSIYQTIGRTIQTDASGSVQQYMGAVVTDGYGSVALRIEGVESAQSAVSC